MPMGDSGGFAAPMAVTRALPTWVVEVTRHREPTRDAVLAAVEHAASEAASIVLVHVVTDVPCGRNRSVAASEADGKEAAEHAKRLVDILVEPLLKIARAANAPCSAVLELNDSRHSGLVVAARRAAADRVYMGAKKKLLGWSSSATVAQCQATLPPSCRLLIAQGGSRLQHLQAAGKASFPHPIPPPFYTVPPSTAAPTAAPLPANPSPSPPAVAVSGPVTPQQPSPSPPMGARPAIVPSLSSVSLPHQTFDASLASPSALSYSPSALSSASARFPPSAHGQVEAAQQQVGAGREAPGNAEEGRRGGGGAAHARGQRSVSCGGGADADSALLAQQLQELNAQAGGAGGASREELERQLQAVVALQQRIQQQLRDSPLALASSSASSATLGASPSSQGSVQSAVGAGARLAMSMSLSQDGGPPVSPGSMSQGHATSPLGPTFNPPRSPAAAVRPHVAGSALTPPPALSPELWAASSQQRLFPRILSAPSPSAAAAAVAAAATGGQGGAESGPSSAGSSPAVSMERRLLPPRRPSLDARALAAAAVPSAAAAALAGAAGGAPSQRSPSGGARRAGAYMPRVRSYETLVALREEEGEDGHGEAADAQGEEEEGSEGGQGRSLADELAALAAEDEGGEGGASSESWKGRAVSSNRGADSTGGSSRANDAEAGQGRPCEVRVVHAVAPGRPLSCPRADQHSLPPHRAMHHPLLNLLFSPRLPKPTRFPPPPTPPSLPSPPTTTTRPQAQPPPNACMPESMALAPSGPLSGGLPKSGSIPGSGGLLAPSSAASTDAFLPLDSFESSEASQNLQSQRDPARQSRFHHLSSLAHAGHSQGPLLAPFSHGPLHARSQGASFGRTAYSSGQLGVGGGGGGGDGFDCRLFSPQQLERATGGYDAANLLGRGSFGQVFRGEMLGCAVAVKRLEGQGWQGPEEFRMEVEVLSRMRHPNIVLLMGCCVEEMALVYEFLPGGTLQDKLGPPKGSAAVPLGWADRLRIAAEVASALLYLHQNEPPIVHRDLKPENILLDAHVGSKIGDVGLARLLEADGATTMKVRGTAGYIDPEEVETCEISTLSDIYALGLILLQLLTGQKSVKAVHRMLSEANSKARARPGDVGPGGASKAAVAVVMRYVDTAGGEWRSDLVEQVAGVALRCADRRRAKRPELQGEIHPLLVRMAAEAQAEVKRRKQQIDEQFICPISKEVMREPVVAADGFTYEREHMERWMAACTLSPATGQPLAHTALTSNNVLKNLIASHRL
ncbi:hypothetical protein CLOM_g2717 [Closterium sp. NIES-68]|nr:hypothetical protein CLOM_g2717 [Closterium sp. NIES-68]